MSDFDSIWKKWLKLSFAFTAATGLISVAFLSYRVSATGNETRGILLQLLRSHFERESPRIADELYLRLESLESRERMLKDLLGQYGDVRLEFERAPPHQQSTSTAPAIQDWQGDSQSSTRKQRLYFGDLSLGTMTIRVNWAPIWAFSSFQTNVLVLFFLTSAILLLWLMIYKSMKKNVFVPIMDEFKMKSTQNAFVDVATQVAHDIRSPLAALTMAERDIASLPEDTRLMIRGSIERINDIATQLISKANRLKKNPDDIRDESIEPTLVSTLVESIIAEKRLQYRSKIDTKIELLIDPDARTVFVDLNSRELKRVISNIVNNSAEAIQGSGTIEVILSANLESKELEIRIDDNGQGIPSPILNQLGQKGATFAKSGGSGLGLYHAFKQIEDWRGKISIESETGSGTSISMKLPVCDPPSWFPQHILIQGRSQILILDDDQSIHQIWKGRILTAETRKAGIELHHFGTPNDLRTWLKSQKARDQIRPFHFLIDYEILESTETGLDLIESLELAPRSILVTSRYEDPELRTRCKNLGLPLLPKSLAGFVPIRLLGPTLNPPGSKAIEGGQVQFEDKASPEPYAVLLDDDHLVHSAWQMVARRKALRLRSYTDVSKFFEDLSTLSAGTPIFVDSCLGKGHRGEDIVRQLSLRGFNNLTLATGYDGDHFKNSLAGIAGLKGVTDKTPPWI